MARLRKAGRILRSPAASTIADRVTIVHGDRVFAIDPSQLFPRDAPLEVELGAGKGDFVIERSSSMPDCNFLAVELAGSVFRMLAVRVGRSELPNVRVLRADARTLVNLLLPDCCVAAYHIYFPDPWPKERQVKHRMFTPFFARNLARTLSDRGRVFVATDVDGYAREIFAILEAAGFESLDESPPGATRSNFARKYLNAGKAIFSRSFAAPAKQPDS